MKDEMEDMMSAAEGVLSVIASKFDQKSALYILHVCTLIAGKSMGLTEKQILGSFEAMMGNTVAINVNDL
jgi:hypothetical protein